jgi:hypothetical protein
MFKFSKKWVKRSFVITLITVFPIVGPAESLEGLEITDETLSEDETSSELKVKPLGAPIEVLYRFKENHLRSKTDSAFQLYVIYHSCESTDEKLWFLTKNGLTDIPTAYCTHNSSSGVPCEPKQKIVLLDYDIPRNKLEFVKKHCFYAAELEAGIDLAKVDISKWTQLNVKNFSGDSIHITRWDPDSTL